MYEVVIFCVVQLRLRDLDERLDGRILPRAVGSKVFSTPRSCRINDFEHVKLAFLPGPFSKGAT
jgi:hypothetical protein